MVLVAESGRNALTIDAANQTVCVSPYFGTALAFHDTVLRQIRFTGYLFAIAHGILALAVVTAKTEIQKMRPDRWCFSAELHS